MLKLLLRKSTNSTFDSRNSTSPSNKDIKVANVEKKASTKCICDAIVITKGPLYIAANNGTAEQWRMYINKLTGSYSTISFKQLFMLLCSDHQCQVHL